MRSFDVGCESCTVAGETYIQEAGSHDAEVLQQFQRGALLLGGLMVFLAFRDLFGKVLDNGELF